MGGIAALPSKERAVTNIQNIGYSATSKVDTPASDTVIALPIQCDLAVVRIWFGVFPVQGWFDIIPIRQCHVHSFDWNDDFL
jgi:hypothetical protein